MFDKKLFIQHSTNTQSHNKMTQAGVKTPFSQQNTYNSEVKKIQEQKKLLNEFQNTELHAQYFDTHMNNGVRAIAHMMGKYPSEDVLRRKLKPHIDAYTEQLTKNHPDMVEGEIKFHQDRLHKTIVSAAQKLSDYM